MDNTTNTRLLGALDECISDTNFEEHPITEVADRGDYVSIYYGGLGFDIDKPLPFMPKEGQTLRIYRGDQWHVVRGAFVDDRMLFYDGLEALKC